MKKYQIQVFSDEVNVKADYETSERAYEMYFKALYSGGYQRGHLLSLETGEVLAHFEHKDSFGNWVINQYISAEIVPDIIKRELYQR